MWKISCIRQFYLRNMFFTGGVSGWYIIRIRPIQRQNWNHVIIQLKKPCARSWIIRSMRTRGPACIGMNRRKNSQGKDARFGVCRPLKTSALFSKSLFVILDIVIPFYQSFKALNIQKQQIQIFYHCAPRVTTLKFLKDLCFYHCFIICNCMMNLSLCKASIYIYISMHFPG